MTLNGKSKLARVMLLLQLERQGNDLGFMWRSLQAAV